jgi:hypothetical protein
VSDIPDDLKPKRIDENTVDFLGIRFVGTPAPPKPVPVTKPEQLAEVRLIGEDGNVYNLIGLCLEAGRRAGYTSEQLKCFKQEAMSGDYDHALQTCMSWFEVS